MWILRTESQNIEGIHFRILWDCFCGEFFIPWIFWGKSNNFERNSKLRHWCSYLYSLNRSRWRYMMRTVTHRQQCWRRLVFYLLVQNMFRDRKWHKLQSSCLSVACLIITNYTTELQQLGSQHLSEWRSVYDLEG